MRHISLTALLIFLLPALALAQRATSNSVCAQPQKEDASDEVVLTVCNYEHGMAPLMQPRLFFRLHKSGRAEYEVDAGATTNISFENQRLAIRAFKITKSDVDEFISLGQADDFQKSAPLYRAIRPWDDSSMESTLIFKYEGREKRVVVWNFIPDDKENDSHYPASLLTMLNKIWGRPPDYKPDVGYLLAHQPNFIATETYTSSFMGHGFSTTYKTAKHAECYRRESASATIFTCLNQPLATFDMKAREYSLAPVERGTRIVGSPFISDVQTIARAHPGQTYRVIGTAKIGDQECLKVEAQLTYNVASLGLQDFTYVFYLARNLNNLVIGVDVTGEQTFVSSRLSNVEFDFPYKIFQRPTGFHLKK